MINEEVVKSLVEARIADTKLFIVDIKIGVGNKILVEIDSDDTLSISDCIDVSRGVEHNLDREEEDFALEVTSPGLDKPLKVRRQYSKNIGRAVKVKRIDGTKLEGELLAVNDLEIVVKTAVKERVEGRKKKEWVITEHTIPFEEIKETHIVISFK